jgi:hypothetical protein
MIFRLSTAVTIPAPHARPQAEHPIVTDGDVAVIRLHDCIPPKVMAGLVKHPLCINAIDWLALMAFRDDFIRSNIFFTTYDTLKNC